MRQESLRRGAENVTCLHEWRQNVPMRHRPRATTVLLAISACLMACTLFAQSLEIIDLRYRTAEEIIPVLQPLLEPGGALSGSDYKLFVRASAGNVAQLRRALEQLDRKPRQLLVSVRRANRQTIERESASASVVLGTRGAGATVTATDAAGQRNERGIASVNVLEGSAAYISTGQSVPIVTAVAAGGRHPWVAASMAHRDLNSGFLVTPRVSGESVVLNIEQQNQQLGADSGAVQTQSLTTQVSGVLGQWIALGGVSESSSRERSSILGRQYSTHSDDLQVWVKVEEH